VSKPLSPSKILGSKTLYAAFESLKDAGGELSVKEVLQGIEARVDLDDWARERYEKSGYIRWQSVFLFYTIGAVKGGFLVKKKGVWFLTKEGEEAMAGGAEGLLKAARSAYRDWKSRRQMEDVNSNSVEEHDEDATEEMTYEQVDQIAREGLEAHILSKNAYEFQDVSAALLRGMGYFTPFVAPRGKDGGIDIIAYRDPLGTESPRIKVQVKHREQSSTVQEIRQLTGILQKDGDIGLFISTGGFTRDAKDAARSAHVHVELIDLPRFIELWQDFYSKLTDEDKAHLPLVPVYFLEPQD